MVGMTWDEGGKRLGMTWDEKRLRMTWDEKRLGMTEVKERRKDCRILLPPCFFCNLNGTGEESIWGEKRLGMRRK